MKKLSLIYLPLLLLSGIQTGNSRNNRAEGNPFTRYGTNVPVGMFSDNPEFHDGERIVEIGPVKFDTRTREVVGFTHTEDPSMPYYKSTGLFTIEFHQDSVFTDLIAVNAQGNQIYYRDPDVLGYFNYKNHTFVIRGDSADTSIFV